MKFKSPQVCVALGLLSLLLPSCASSKVDATTPTISQMDKLDTQWGLPPRQSKGTPHKHAPSASAQNTPAAAPVYSPPAATLPAPASQPVAIPSQPAPIIVDPSVIQKLR